MQQDPAVPALRHFFTPDPFWRTLVGNGIAMGESLPATSKKACQDAFSARPANGDLNVREVAMFNCPSPVRTFLERVNCMAGPCSEGFEKKFAPKRAPNLCFNPPQVFRMIYMRAICTLSFTDNDCKNS